MSGWAAFAAAGKALTQPKLLLAAGIYVLATYVLLLLVALVFQRKPVVGTVSYLVAAGLTQVLFLPVFLGSTVALITQRGPNFTFDYVQHNLWSLMVASLIGFWLVFILQSIPVLGSIVSADPLTSQFLASIPLVLYLVHGRSDLLDVSFDFIGQHWLQLLAILVFTKATWFGIGLVASLLEHGRTSPGEGPVSTILAVFMVPILSLLPVLGSLNLAITDIEGSLPVSVLPALSQREQATIETIIQKATRQPLTPDDIEDFRTTLQGYLVRNKLAADDLVSSGHMVLGLTTVRLVIDYQRELGYCLRDTLLYGQTVITKRLLELQRAMSSLGLTNQETLRTHIRMLEDLGTYDHLYRDAEGKWHLLTLPDVERGLQHVNMLEENFELLTDVLRTLESHANNQ